MRRLLLTGLALLGLTACREEVQNPPAVGARITIPSLEWRVVSKQQLVGVYRDSGMQLRDGQDLKGFIGKYPDGRVVMYTLPPKSVDDDVTLTIGHEVLHAALGPYHRTQQ